MNATVMFDRDKLEWILVGIHLTKDFDVSATKVKQRLSLLGLIKFPFIVDVNLLTFKVTGENKFSWSCGELPKTPTIEECINKNRCDIAFCLSKLKR